MRVGIGVTVWAREVRGHLDGIGVYTRNLWQALQSRGCNFRGVRFGSCGEDFGGVAESQCIPFTFQFQAAVSTVFGTPFFGAKGLEQRVDLFHATDHHIPRLRHTPVLATIHDAIPFVHPEWVSQRLRAAKNFAFRRTAHWASHIVTVSEFSRQDIAEKFGIDEDRISVVWNGVNEEFFQRLGADRIAAVLERYSVPRGCFIFVGTLQPRKNVRRVIDAHRSLPEAIRRSHPLLIVGRYGWGEDTLKAELELMEREQRGRWLRDVPTEDLFALLQSACSLVYPSLYEGFGLPVLEGFASGIPVVSSNRTSIPEVAGEAALLVDPESVEDIAGAMERIAEDSSYAATLVERGSSRAREFSWDRCAAQTFALYQTLAGSKA